MVPGAFFATAASVPWRRSLLLLPTLGLVLLWQLCRLLHRLWWRPRCLERELRSKGLRGTSYRFLTGDLREQGRRNKDAWSRPLPLRCHDIAPRVAPLLCDSVGEHGKVSLSWFGPIPKVTIADPELAKSVLSDKSGHFEKPKFPALWKLLANGLLNHEGDKWVKHRRLLNPAFHLEKIKCMLPEFSACCEELVGSYLTGYLAGAQKRTSWWAAPSIGSNSVGSNSQVRTSWIFGRSSKTCPEMSFLAPHSAAATLKE